MMLRLAPHLVGPLEGIEPVGQAAAYEPASVGWVTRERTEAGHIGNPGVATAEKGEALFRVFADDVVAFLRRVAAGEAFARDGR